MVKVKEACQFFIVLRARSSNFHNKVINMQYFEHDKQNGNFSYSSYEIVYLKTWMKNAMVKVARVPILSFTKPQIIRPNALAIEPVY